MRHGVCFPSGGAFSAPPSLLLEPIVSVQVWWDSSIYVGVDGDKGKKCQLQIIWIWGYSV